MTRVEKGEVPLKSFKPSDVHPVLYVGQQNNNSPKANMQSTFVSKVESKNESKDNDQKVVDKKQENERLQSTKTIEVENKKEVESPQSMKPLKDMTVQEKIDYLTSRPKYIPHIPCLIVLKNENVIGYIKEKVNNTLLVDVSSNLTITVINIEEISDIFLYVNK